MIVPSWSFFSGFGGNFFLLFFGLFSGLLKILLEGLLLLLPFEIFLGLLILKLGFLLLSFFWSFFLTIFSSSSSSFSSFWMPLSLSCLSSSSIVSGPSSRTTLYSYSIKANRKKQIGKNVSNKSIYFLLNWTFLLVSSVMTSVSKAVIFNSEISSFP